MSRPFKTLVELLQFSVEDYGERELFGEKHPDGSWHWTHVREFSHLVDNARAGLVQLGVGKGDRVAMVSDNRIEWAVFAFASYGLGACFVPMYEAQKPDEWGFILDDCAARVVVGATGAIFVDLQKLAASIDTLKHTIGLTLPEEDPESYKHLLSSGKKAPVAALDVKPQDLAGFIYTSGTTGNPKGVKLSHANLSQNIVKASDRFPFTPDDRSLAFLPWAHAFGLVAELGSFMHVGASIAINDEVPQLITNLPTVRPTILVAVPRIFNRIYDGVNKQMEEKPAAIRAIFEAGVRAATKKNRGERLGFGESLTLSLADKLIFRKVRQKFGGRLRFVVSGSAALSTQVAEFIDALGIDVFEGYGLTETSPVISVNYPGNRKIGSVGKCIEGVVARIDDSATDAGVDGEIVVSGHNIMQGYHNRPEENARIFCDDGALRTGDMGHIDDEGFLFITGRIKEQYKLETGKYVVPSPLEEELKLSPFIANIMLYGSNRPYNVAIVVPDMPALLKYCEAKGIDSANIESNTAINQLLLAQVQKYGAEFKRYEVPQKITVIAEDFTTENNMLTPSMKLKRRNVLLRYQENLNALY